MIMRFIAAKRNESRFITDVQGVRMSVLKIIALLILAGSLVTFIVQCVKGKARSSILFVATAILSIVLFVLAGRDADCNFSYAAKGAGGSLFDKFLTIFFAGPNQA